MGPGHRKAAHWERFLVMIVLMIISWTLLFCIFSVLRSLYQSFVMEAGLAYL
ncbi:TPA_asm: hypothetical protein [ssRNA phage Esthiorhiza.4_7]|uniref:Uncharacterized protein n=2 Tax=Leviviricetes TaxID=2842243 RepID=A0A8S5KYH9_9VIRU|nr:hypothetical protein QIP07_gp3 [ssRNA phage Esthiorhiza.4_7]QDH89581.1 MAG: hypothetical protein H4RhizoLitter20331_000003 [Leviviridae sp.]DAD50235.1 TPA_asm: hypothetical protein [ssRNA phage Esthiorhiza.4_7]